MQQIEIKIFHAKRLNRMIDGFLCHFIILHILNPHLGCDEQFFAGANSFCNRLTDGFPNGIFICIRSRRVDQTIARPDGI